MEEGLCQEIRNEGKQFKFIGLGQIIRRFKHILAESWMAYLLAGVLSGYREILYVKVHCILKV